MHYPVFLDLEGKKCAVVGSGQVGERRARGLIASGAHVVVIGVNATSGLLQLQKTGDIQLFLKAFEGSDLEDCFLVIAATNDLAVNHTVQEQVHQQGILFCGADHDTQSDFIVPAVIQQGHLQIAISTNGKSPAYAKLVRVELEKWLGDGHGRLLDLLAGLRPRVFAQFSDDPDRRQMFWQNLVTSDLLALADKGQWPQIEERIDVCLSL
jgi:precorrin-2 dehydrogenase/sirohydrochlorin ferrochelatase